MRKGKPRRDRLRLLDKFNQWRTHGGGGGGFGGRNPPIDDWKKMKTSLFETIRLFSYRDCRSCYQLPCFSVLSNFLNMLHNLEKLSLWRNNTGSQTFLVRYAWRWRLQKKWNLSFLRCAITGRFVKKLFK